MTPDSPDSPPVGSRGLSITFAILTAIVLAIGVALILSSMNLVDWFWPIMLAVWVLPVCGLAWLILVVIGIARFRRWWPEVPAVAAVLTVALLLYFDLPVRAQWALSWNALDDVAADCRPSGPRWAGLVRLEEVQSRDGMCLLYTGGFIDRIGIANAPDGPPPDARQDLGMTFTHSHDDWYTFVWHF